MVEVLKSKGLKATPQRISILKELNKKEHPTIDELYSKIKKDFPSISLATVYKNINTLKECGVVTERSLVNSKSRFDIHIEPHIEIVCPKCGKIEDYKHSKETLEILNNLQKSIDLDIEGFDIAAYSLCEECRAGE